MARKRRIDETWEEWPGGLPERLPSGGDMPVAGHRNRRAGAKKTKCGERVGRAIAKATDGIRKRRHKKTLPYT